MEYSEDTINRARGFLKYIKHDNIVDLVNEINSNEKDFEKIKSLLDGSIDNIFNNLPIQNNTLKENVFITFVCFVKNKETHIWRYGILKMSYNTFDSSIVSTQRKITIPALTGIATIAVNEWINQSLAELQEKNRIEDKPRRRVGFIVDGK